MLFTLSGAQLADMGSLADSSAPPQSSLPFSVVCHVGSKSPFPLTAAAVLWRQQDKPQTETLKDFWTLTQWADSVRRWLASPSRPLPGLHPPLPTPALASSCQPWPAGIPPRVWVSERDRGGHRCCFGEWCAGLYLHHQSAVQSQGSRETCVYLSVLG